MTPERWKKAKEIFQAALDRAPGERSAFLTSACGGNEALRREVESLVAAHEKSGEFIDSPAYQAAAEMIVDDKAELKPGQTIGAYEIISFISRGGMGEVYLAQDRRLSRKAALKVLPASLTKDSDRLGRFEQEARAASALNHPNIITIYEILSVNSTHVIATEFVEGETLRQRLSYEPLPLMLSLNIAIQIADALNAAHQAGIIHRDIKPENVMLRPDGYVKVLDFGLAKLSEQSSATVAAEAPTRQVRTGSGVVIGTAGYMSPEQARGRDVDPRTDIFSLGATIYEMIAHCKPFEGETPSDTLAAILKTDPPPLGQVRPETPAELARIVNKTLMKDREERYQVVKDLLLDLKTLAGDWEFEQRLRQTPPLGTSAPVPARSEFSKPRHEQRTDEIGGANATTISRSGTRSIIQARRWPLLALVAVAIVGLSFALYRYLQKSPKNVPVTAPVVGNIARITAWSGLDTHPTLSPDGNAVAYSSNRNGSFELYVKQLTPGGREIPLTTDGQENFQPAWSPDGHHVAYYSKNRGGIWVVPAFGGEARQLTDFGASPRWSRDGGQIVFQSDSNPDLGAGSVGSSTIWIVSSQGGTPKQITKIGNPRGGHVGPAWSRDGKRIAFVALNFNAPDQQVWSVSLDGADPRQMTQLMRKGRVGYPIYALEDRALYFVAGSTIWMLPVSPETGDPAGEPIKVSDAGASNITNLAISADGSKMVYSAQSLTSNIWSIPVSASANPAGPARPLTNQTDVRNNFPAWSPDGRKLAFAQVLRGGAQSVWVIDEDGKNPTQVTIDSSFMPNWFPDGDQIAFVSFRENRRRVWVTSLTNRKEQLLFDNGREIEYARLSADGKHIAFNLADQGITNVWIIPVSGGSQRQLTFDKELAAFGCWSPDGKFIAYQMKRGDDAYVMIVPSEGGQPQQLTFDRGRSWPHSFSPDGDKIVFAGDRNGVWNVWWISRSSKQQRQLTTYTKLNGYVRYPTWSPRGDQIAYEYAETAGNIWLMELK